VRICALGAAALIALCSAGGAQAKGPDLARACGASGCATGRGGVRVDSLIEWMSSMFTLAEAPRPAPYYRITFRDHGTLFMTLLWVPARHRMRVLQPAVYPFAPGSNHPYWRPVSARGAAVLGRAVARLKPFSAPRAWR
jgi:hypothetical protein